MFGDGCGEKGFSQRIATGEFEMILFWGKVDFLSKQQSLHRVNNYVLPFITSCMAAAAV